MLVIFIACGILVASAEIQLNHIKNQVTDIRYDDIKEEYKTTSSSKVRELLHEKRLTSVKDYIPDEILSYIIKNKILHHCIS